MNLHLIKKKKKQLEDFASSFENTTANHWDISVSVWNKTSQLCFVALVFIGGTKLQEFLPNHLLSK